MRQKIRRFPSLIHFLPLFFGACAAPATDDATPAVSRVADSAGDAVWFGPNVGSPDLLDLFRHPDQWSRTRQTVGVFQFYAQQTVSDAAACPTCGPNILPNLAAVDAFGQLGQWGTAIAVEIGALKYYACDADTAAHNADAVIAAIESQGGKVRYLSMDEPYIGALATVDGRSCHLPMASAAQQTAQYIREVQQRHPGTLVGDVEPYPYFSIDQLIAWEDALADNGATPAYLHLDVDRNDVKNRGSNVTGDLQRLKSALAARHIPMGVIFMGLEIELPRDAGPSSDQAYHDTVMSWVQTTHAAIGVPEHSVFQSWVFIAGGNTVPHNLPETGWGHTRLIDDGWALLSPNGTQPQPQPQPQDPPASDAATIVVQHGYRGLLGREADPSGLAWYAGQIGSGKMKTIDFCRALAGSPEWSSTHGALSPAQLADGLYQGILERAGDEGGLTAATAQIAAGHLADEAAGMLDSPEFHARFL
jgi:hypothetical protein